MIQHLAKISTGQGILPRALRDEMQALVDELPPPPIQPWILAGDSDEPLLLRDEHVLRFELDEARDILQRSARCDEQQDTEHAQTVSQAFICRALLPRNMSGSFIGNKMVDFCILFGNLEAEEPAVLHHIRELVGSERDDRLQTANQSILTSLVLQPSAVAIETKATSGNGLEAKVQLQ
ncbi:hypothetical protein QBC39DRAFT_376986 [Podospora conica]|nr:hypothetical protein QBC39DRAFT_376986 [Schizothecium conicum]